MLFFLLLFSLIIQGPTTTTFAQYPAHTYPPCRCEKGDRGDKGDAGICPTDCTSRYEAYTKNCLGTRMNIERLAQSIRQLIIDTKKIASRNAQIRPCTCEPKPTTLDYSTYQRLKGDKGDPGTSCSCPQQIQTNNIRVFKTTDEALASLYTYPDHTYIHIVNDYGRLQNVLIRFQNQLIPIKIENQNSLTVQQQQQTFLPPTTLSIPKTSCSITLTCPRLHIFALGPHIRKMCAAKRDNNSCTKLAEYDELCGRVSERQQLKGYYRAFMSSSTQWLSNLFTGICVQAKIVNMHEQTLFDKVEDIFDQKPPQNEVLDVEGLRPRFQYWWHGSYVNGTASTDTCHDWSRHDSNLSGIASRMPDGMNGLFHDRYVWPCSIGESNMGILCIETNCNRDRYYKH